MAIDSFVRKARSSLRLDAYDEKIRPLTNIKEEIVEAGVIRLEEVPGEAEEQNPGYQPMLQSRRASAPVIGFERFESFEQLHFRRLSQASTSRVISDSSGRLVGVDDERLREKLGVDADQFEEELRLCFESQDVDHDGLISSEELYSLAYKQGFPIGRDAVGAVVDIAGSGGKMDFSQFVKFNYDVLNAQMELDDENELNEYSETNSGRVMRKATKQERKLLAEKVLAEEEIMVRLFDKWDRLRTGQVHLSDLLLALNKIPEVKWSGSAIRAGIRALLRYDDEANNKVDMDQFVYVINDICVEELGVDFVDIAPQLLAVAEGRNQSDSGNSSLVGANSELTSAESRA